jgi:uncharacterized protein YjbJ (UPF0337 family)
MEDKVKGRMKEAYGAITGDEDLKAEGQALQRKAAAREEAAQKARTRQAQQEAKEAEMERDRQERKDKGLLGSVGDPCRDFRRARRLVVVGEENPISIARRQRPTTA